MADGFIVRRGNNNNNNNETNELNIITWGGQTLDDTISNNEGTATINEMVAASKNGEISLSNYWAIGDERTVHLSRIYNTSLNKFFPNVESVPEQDITLVLMNNGFKQYNSQRIGNFVVGQKDVLSIPGRLTNEDSGSYDRRSAFFERLSIQYKNGLPSDIRDSFREFQYANTYSSSYKAYFCLCGVIEVSGTGSGDWTGKEQFEYYKTTSNRIKKITPSSGNPYNIKWWTRTAYTYSSPIPYCIDTDGNAITSYKDNYGFNTQNTWNSSYGIAPFGVI